MEKLVLIDGHSILNRAFYGVPNLTNSEGLHTNAVYGFLNILFKVLDEEKADYLAVAFDLKRRPSDIRCSTLQGNKKTDAGGASRAGTAYEGSSDGHGCSDPHKRGI